MDEYQNSDSEYITDESSSFEEEDYEVYKKVEMDVSQMGNQNEIIIEITNNKSNQKSDYQFEQITDLIFKIEDEYFAISFFLSLIIFFINLAMLQMIITANSFLHLRRLDLLNFKYHNIIIQLFKKRRDLKFLTCTKSIKLAYNMLRSIDLSQVEEINLTLPIKDSYTDQFSAEQKQNAIWDGDDDTMQEKMQIEKEKEKSKKEATAKKNKEYWIVFDFIFCKDIETSIQLFDIIYKGNSWLRKKNQ